MRRYASGSNRILPVPPLRLGNRGQWSTAQVFWFAEFANCANRTLAAQVRHDIQTPDDITVIGDLISRWRKRNLNRLLMGPHIFSFSVTTTIMAAMSVCNLGKRSSWQEHTPLSFCVMLCHVVLLSVQNKSVFTFSSKSTMFLFYHFCSDCLLCYGC